MTTNNEIKELIAYQEKVKLGRKNAMKTYSDKNREKIREINNCTFNNLKNIYQEVVQLGANEASAEGLQNAI